MIISELIGGPTASLWDSFATLSQSEETTFVN